MNSVDQRYSELRAPSQDAAGAPLSALDDPHVRQAVREYLKLVEAGKRPERDEFLARYPAITSALAECLDGLDLVHEVVAELEEPGDVSRMETHVPLGDYRIVREIGRGGMGVVFEATQLSLGRRVALKVLPFAAALDPRHLQRFKNEAQAASLLHHANIVPVYGLGCDRGVHYFAMQFIEGHTLAEVIADLRVAAAEGPRTLVDESSHVQRSPSDPAKAAAETRSGGPAAALSTERSTRTPEYIAAVARLGAQSADALEHAHQLGVIHRDIKPANLMVDATGRLWITDFGLARCRTEQSLTMTGDVVGTLRYMSPEQALARHGLVDQRTDIYSLGVTLYELLTLEPAYAGSDRAELLRLIASSEPRPPRRINPKVPVELETIVLKAIAREPEHRYGSAGELADDLRRFLEHRPVLAKRTTLLERAAKWAWRRRSLVAAAGVGLILAVATLLVSTILLWRANEATRSALRDADKERQRAERNFARALSGVNQLLWELEVPRWAGMERIMQLREVMTKRGIAYFQEFIQEDSADPAVLFESGRAYKILASVHCGQQDAEKAQIALARAIGLFGQLAAAHPEVIAYRVELARAHRLRGILLNSLGHPDQAGPDLTKVVELFQSAIAQKVDKGLLNELAWFLADCPCTKFRDPAHAITYVEEAIALAPNDRRFWNTLGVARYRAGELPAAASAFRKSMDLRTGGDPYDWFFLAMICWQEGDRSEANAWYDKASAWLHSNTLMTEELFRYQVEAAKMLGREEAKTPQARSP